CLCSSAISFARSHTASITSPRSCAESSRTRFVALADSFTLLCPSCAFKSARETSRRALRLVSVLLIAPVVGSACHLQCHKAIRDRRPKAFRLSHEDREIAVTFTRVLRYRVELRDRDSCNAGLGVKRRQNTPCFITRLAALSKQTDAVRVCAQLICYVRVNVILVCVLRRSL